MKKKIFIFSFLTALTIITTLKVDFSENPINGLALANIEALAYLENPDPTKFIKLETPCFDSNKVPTGKTRVSCSHPGFEPTCIPHGCQ